MLIEYVNYQSFSLFNIPKIQLFRSFIRWLI